MIFSTYIVWSLFQFKVFCYQISYTRMCSFFSLLFCCRFLDAISNNFLFILYTYISFPPFSISIENLAHPLVCTCQLRPVQDKVRMAPFPWPLAVHAQQNKAII
jgi:hypothetical protein